MHDNFFMTDQFRHKGMTTMKQMVSLGDRTFIASNTPVSERPPSFDGYFQKMKHGVRFFDADMTLKFFLVANSDSENWFVTARKLENGHIFYMHSLDSLTSKWLGLDSDFKAREKGFSSAFSMDLLEAKRIWNTLKGGVKMNDGDREIDIFRQTQFINEIFHNLVAPNPLIGRDNIFGDMLTRVQEARTADFGRGDDDFRIFLDRLEEIGKREIADSANDPDSDLTLSQIETRVANNILETIAASRKLGYAGLDYAANKAAGDKYRLAALMPTDGSEKPAGLKYQGRQIHGLREALPGEIAIKYAVVLQDGNEIIAGFNERHNAEGFAMALNGPVIESIEVRGLKGDLEAAGYEMGR